jgi:predicted metal-dependent peptidase
VGVTKEWLLLWDPQAIQEWDVSGIACALEHECWHVLRRHAERCEKASLDHTLFNIAGDLEINDDMISAGAMFPHGTGIKPADFGLKDGGLAEQYYHDIRKQCSDGQGGHSKAPSKPSVGQGWCGSAGGHSMPDEPEGQAEGGRSATEKERIRKQVAHEIQSAKSRGNVPEAYLRWADEQLGTPKIPWQQKLSRATKMAVAWKMGAVDYRYDQPSRRQAGLGYGVGKPILPALRKSVPEVWFVCDTSGSMGKEELTAALREGAGAIKATGAPVTFLAADADVHEVKKVTRWEEIIPLMKGGGGTDFTPVFSLAEKPGKVARPEILIFATDGDGTCPEKAPVGIRVIWLLVGRYKRAPCDWGEQVEVD